MNRKKTSKDFTDLDQVFEIIEQEKKLEPNPFLASRILSSIGNENVGQMQINRPLGLRLLNPALIGLSVAAAVTVGVIIGNLYNPNKNFIETTSDFSYMNDVAIESVLLLTNE